MPNDWFQFKEFRIKQDRCAMKVGTDAVILGAWTEITGAGRALDIGTGTGLLALMIAQRNSEVRIEAIEIDSSAAEQSAENIASCRFGNRIAVSHISFQDYLDSGKESRFDLIVCNPPYFSKSQKGASGRRNIARHDDMLPLSLLLYGAGQLLSEAGKLGLILPGEKYLELMEMLRESDLHIKRVLEIYPKPGKEPSRYCVEIERKKTTPEISKLMIESGGRHEYSEEYLELTRDFYL